MPGEPHRFSRVAEDLIASLRKVPSEDPRGIRRRASHDLAELIDALRAKHGIGRPTTEQAIRDQWPQVVGPANASYSHAVRIDERGRLVVHATHAVVRNELFLNRAEIIERIRRIPGCASVRQLHLSQG
jgi:Dna[CI] antecedent DciA-like protein